MASSLAACRTRYIEIPRIVEKEIIKVVTEIVRQTVIVPATPEGGPPEIVPTPPVSDPAPEPPLSITFDSMQHGWNALARRIAPAFQELFPGSQLVWRSATPWPQYADRIAALAAADDLGDVIEAPLGTPIRLWADHGILGALGDLVEAEGYDIQGVFPAALAEASHHGGLYGVPLTAHPGDCLILVNSELVDPSLVLHDDGSLRLEFAESVKNTPASTNHLYVDDLALPSALTALGAFGARWLNDQGTQTRLHTPASLEAISWAAGIRRGGLVPPPWRLEATPERIFGAGELAILRTSFAGLWLLQRADLLPRHTEMGMMPVRKSADSGALTGEIEGVAYCLTGSCRNPSLALQWLKFMTTREMGVQMLLGGYGAPGARLAAWHDPRVLDYLPICARLGNRCATIAAQPLPWNLATNACFDAWNQRVSALWDADVPTSKWTQETARAITEILSRPRDQTAL